jgi:hypothetical protein
MATARLNRDEATDGHLPRTCVKCGVAATVERRKAFSWCPPWVSVLILAGVLPYAIVASILTRKMTARLPFCDAHKGHYRWRNWFLWGGLAGCGALAFAVFVVMVAQDNPGRRQASTEQLNGLLCLGTMAVGLVWLIAAAIIQNTAIRPTEITEGNITLTNVCSEFVDALDEYRERHEEYRSRWRPPSRWSREDDREPPRGRERDDDDAYRERPDR